MGQNEPLVLTKKLTQYWVGAILTQTGSIFTSETSPKNGQNSYNETRVTWSSCVKSATLMKVTFV